MRVCFTSSSGGHFEQLLMLKSLFAEYDSFIVTEKTKYNQNFSEVPIYFTKQVNRRNVTYFIAFFYNVLFSFYIFVVKRPDIVVSTGVLSTIPLCLIAKLFRKKVIYIESFAKINSPTLTGRVMYKFADIFYVQWPEMLKVYPKAKYIGGIY